MFDTLKSSEELVLHIKQKLADFAIEFGPKIIGAILILVVGLVIAQWLCGRLMAWLNKLNLEPPVRKLITRVAWLMIMGFTMLLVLEKLEVKTAPLIAGIGVAGVGIGLATQGVLGNLVAGLLIIFTKPFRVGEYIELIGVNGVVTNIELFSTVLLHADQSRVVIPNRKIIGEILHNYGTVRQVDMVVGVAYGTKPDDALAAVNDVLAINPRVLKEPAPMVGIVGLGDFTVNIAIKPWVKVADYGPAQAEINKAILEEFKKRGIEIPFPQREVRVLNLPANAA